MAAAGDVPTDMGNDGDQRVFNFEGQPRTAQANAAPDHAHKDDAPKAA